MQQESDQLVYLKQGQYPMLLHQEMSENAEGTLYFSLPNQDDYLFEYEGDLDEALDDLPAVYEATETQLQTLSSEAIVVVEQLWDYFDRTGEHQLEGQHEYNFAVNGDRLLILPKDGSGEVVVVDRAGQVQSSFASAQFEHLMERFAIAYEQLRSIERSQESTKDIELC